MFIFALVLIAAAMLGLKDLVTRGFQKTCPYCLKEVHRQATKCPYCRSDLAPTQ
jgi:hypothetical protein